MIGLPPTKAEQQSFVASLAIERESAYEAAVDRLLSSPHLEERWASMWLDQVRYADSRGYGEDSPRNIWKYRDWVINAFNQDMPYDEFSVHQLAGDLLPDADIQSRLATAVHRLTQTNEEGGTDDEEFRTMAIIDRISTTWQTWMGTTYGCVQCHSHPYDPFNHEDYYRFAAYFNNTADCDLDNDWPNLSVPLSPLDYEKASQLDSQINNLQQSLWQREWDITSEPTQWQPTRIATAKTANATKVVIENHESWDEVHSVGTISRRPHLTVELPIPESIADGQSPITAMPLDASKALLDAEVGFVMSHVFVAIQGADGKTKTPAKIARLCGDEPFPVYDPQESLNPKSKEGFAAFSKIHHARPVTLILENPIDVGAQDKIKITIKHDVFDLAASTLMTRRARFDFSTNPKLSPIHSSNRIGRISQSFSNSATRFLPLKPQFCENVRNR